VNLEIPTLRLESTRRAPTLDWPVLTWGSVSRWRRAGTWSFFTDDFRFNGLWSNPDQIVGVRTKPTGAFEVNWSVFDASPRAVAVWAVYRKRWLARHWQQHGVSVWVDLCFAHRHFDLALLGVPKGWQRYATRGFEARVTDLDFELRQAKRHADGAPFTLAVYGGGKLTKAWCERHQSVIHVPHFRSAQHRPGEGSRRVAMRAANG
jgi:hypothetical protein